MKVSLDGLCENASRHNGYRFSLCELRDNLRELRDHPEQHAEFFALYTFRDDTEYQKRRAERAEAGQQPVTQTKCAKHKWKHVCCAGGMTTYRCEVCGAETDDWMNWGDLNE